MSNQKNDIPRWPQRFLRWFCPPELLEEIEGDLIQRFERDAKKYHNEKAKRRLLWNTLRFFRLGILMRNKMSTPFNQIQMFSNYFKTTYRHAIKNKLSFGFRLGGLTLAIFSFLVIALYVSFQLSFDKFHDDYKNIYRINSVRQENGKEVRCASVPSAMGAALKAEFAEVKSYVIVSEWASEVMRVDDKLLRTGLMIEAEQSVFDVFTFQFIAGDKTALTKPGGIVLSEILAKKLFGDDNPMHQLISFPDEHNKILEVRAVIKDLPANSSINAQSIVNYGALRDSGDGELYSWSIGYGGNLFIRLSDQVDPIAFQEKLKPLLARNLRKSFDKSEENFQAFLQPLSDVYLGEPLRWEFDRKGNAVYLFIYISLAVFLLIIAGINYLNLSIADFSFRNKEIGVRKVLGARKKQIVFQVCYESAFYCLLALFISIGILYISFPHVLNLFELNLNFFDLVQQDVLAWVLASIFILIVVSAAYPAYCLSVNNPIHDLKRKQLIGRNLSVNNVLLLAQFVISVFCISATWVVGNQLKYIQTKDIGLNRNNLLQIYMPYRYPLEKAPVLKQEISRIPAVQSASFSYYRTVGDPYFNAWYKVESGIEMKPIMLNETFVDEDFISTMGLTLVEGRNFNGKSEFKSAFILNESAAKEFGWEHPLGKKIAVGNEKEEGGIWSEGTVIGVVKDFNTRSLHKKIEPLVMRLQYDEWPGSSLNIRYSGDEQDVIASIKRVHEKVLPGFLMDYGRVNDRYDNLYKTENKAFAALQTVTWIILLISCIGIFSMSMFISFKRQKEFGIRKVVGASATQITRLHINHFIRVGLIANVIALPIAYFVMKGWLNGFAYKGEVSLFQFASFGILLLIFIALSAGYSAWKSGRMNPVDVIKAD